MCYATVANPEFSEGWRLFIKLRLLITGEGREGGGGDNIDHLYFCLQPYEGYALFMQQFNKPHKGGVAGHSSLPFVLLPNMQWV